MSLFLYITFGVSKRGGEGGNWVGVDFGVNLSEGFVYAANWS